MFKTAKKLKEPDSASHAYEYCIFLLSLRLRTEGELQEKMRGRGYAPKAIDLAIAQLYDHKYIDDVRYAEVFVDNLKQYKYYGYMMIKQKLMLKKLPRTVIDSVLEENFQIEDEVKVARRYLKKDYQTFDKEKLKFEEKQKIAKRMQAKGFRGQAISKILF